MRVIVIGAGEVGFDVARILSMDQHDVIVVDVDPDRLAGVSDRLDVMTIQGNGTSARVLEEAKIRSADLLIAVAAIDEVNIIACMMASRLGVKTTVARVRSHELADSHSVLSASDFGIDLIIHPEESTAREIVGLLRRASATDCPPNFRIILSVLRPSFEASARSFRTVPTLFARTTRCSSSRVRRTCRTSSAISERTRGRSRTS